MNSLNKVLKECYRLTGLYLDQYGTTRIYQDNVNLLLSLIKDQITFSVSSKHVHIAQLQSIIAKLSLATNDLLAIGD